MSAETDGTLWISPASAPTVVLTAAQKGSLALLRHSRLLPECLPEAAAAEGHGAVLLDYSWYPGDADTIRVFMTAGGDLVSVQYRHEPCAGDGEGPGEWKVDSGELWAGLKGAVGQV